MSLGRHCPECGVALPGASSPPDLCPGCLLKLGIASHRPEADLDVTSAEPAHWGPLEIVERLGDGGFGEVYRALDTRLDRSVALKLLRKDPGDLGSIVIEEGRLMARVRHPNVVTVYGAERHDGSVGLWMEFVRGRTLAQVIEEGGPLGAHEATAIGLDLCRALAAVHAAGLIHRDVKAQNVMREQGGRVVLMDFGAGQETEQVADGAALSGTPLYMAPEILRGDPSTVRSDLYSLGVLLYFLVTASYPVRARSMKELREAHERRESARLRDERPDLPASFIRAVERALAVDYEQRYGTAGEMERALAEAITTPEPPSPATPAPPGSSSDRRAARRRGRPLLIALPTLATALVAVGLIVFLPDDESTSGSDVGKAEQTEPSSPGATQGTASEVGAPSTEPDEQAAAPPPTGLREAAETRTAHAPLTEEARRHLDDLDRLAAIHTQQGDYDRADPLIAEALRIRRRDLGDGHPEVARTMADLAWCRASARQEDASELFARALAIFERTERADPLQLASVLTQQATIAGSVEAEALLRRALAVLEAEVGAEDPRLAGVLENLGFVLAASGNGAEAGAVLDRARSLRRKAASKDDVDERSIGLADLGTATLASTPYSLEVALYRASTGGGERLVPGDRVEPGDELFLEIETTRRLHVYVLNQDEAGNAYVLYPLAGSELRNPLPPGGPHRLPGSRNGNRLHWQISSAGGREHILIVASPERLVDLEIELEAVPEAGAEASPTYASLPEPTLRRLRGIGRLVERPAAAAAPSVPAPVEGSRIFERAKRLASARESSRGIWIRQVDLENPLRGGES